MYHQAESIIAEALTGILKDYDWVSHVNRLLTPH